MSTIVEERRHSVERGVGVAREDRIVPDFDIGGAWVTTGVAQSRVAPP